MVTTERPNRLVDITLSGAAEREGSRGGIVYLVGAGPGDPDLITRKGLRVLRGADIVIYDRLVAQELVDEARPIARRIFVGKEPGCHTMPQDAINALLVRYARQGRVVVRLKGGDPYVFGRGGEEAAALAAAGVPFEVVPGVTAAVAVPAYAGIPVTQRGCAPLFTVVTGHEDGSSAGGGAKATDAIDAADAKDATAVDWETLAALGGTLVIMMGVAALPRLTERLLRGGLSPLTPAAVIQNGTLPNQRKVQGTLATIAARAAAARLGAPAVTVIGEVAALADTLGWFGSTSPGAVTASRPAGRTGTFPATPSQSDHMNYAIYEDDGVLVRRGS